MISLKYSSLVLSLVCVGCRSLSANTPDQDIPEPKATALAWVDENAADLKKLNRVIWEAAELGLDEHVSSKALREYLRRHGFTIESGLAGMPTAFVASYGSGEPVVAILAEFDALPGMSQKATPEQTPHVEGGNGHACGHSAFGAGSTGGAVATRYAMEKHGLKGTIRLYGTPAEETGIGKTYMVKEGVFSDCDAALHWHPSSRTKTSYSLCKAIVSVKYTFHGLPAHASLSPHDGRSALDAVELMNIGANFLREHLKEDARIHYVISDGGGQPNVVPPRAQVWYYLRANDHRDVEHLFARIEKIARGAALMTDTDLEIEVASDSHELVPNRPLSELIQRNLMLVGAPVFDDAEKSFARKTQEPLVAARGRSIEMPLSEEIDPLPDEPDLIRASTDVGDVSWMVPTGGFRVACYTYGAPGHSWQIVACTGMSIGEKGLVVASRVMSASAIEILGDVDLLAAAKRDFAGRREGIPYTSLIPKDQKAPLKIR